MALNLCVLFHLDFITKELKINKSDSCGRKNSTLPRLCLEILCCIVLYKDFLVVEIVFKLKVILTIYETALCFDITTNITRKIFIQLF